MKTLRPKTEQLWFGTVTEGKQLLLTAEINGKSLDIVSIFADDKDESQWVQIESHGQLIQIPITVLESMIKDAKDGVRSEKWYEENVYSKIES